MASTRIPLNPFIEFSGPEEERLHLKQRLAAAFRIFGRFGFDEGVAGHITARDPEHADHFWVNPFGMNFKHDHGRRPDPASTTTGEVVEGDWPVNRAAFAIHSQVHAARPDVVAAAHSHSVYGKAFSSLGKQLDPLTQDACIFFEDHALFDDYTGVVLDLEEGKRHRPRPRREQGGHPPQPRPAHRRPQRRRGRLLVHRRMERTCQAELLARAAGEPVADRRRRGPPDLHARSAATWPAGSAPSRCSTGSSRPSPTCCRAPSWSRRSRRPR